jgi:hypothetical protein
MKKNIGDLKFLPKIGNVVRVDVEKIGTIVASSMAIYINPYSERPPRKCMRSLEIVDMKTIFHSQILQIMFYPKVLPMTFSRLQSFQVQIYFKIFSNL